MVDTPFVPLIVVFGYVWFYLYAAWVYDAPSAGQRWRCLGALGALDVLMGWYSASASAGCRVQ